MDPSENYVRYRFSFTDRPMTVYSPEMLPQPYVSPLKSETDVSFKGHKVDIDKVKGIPVKQLPFYNPNNKEIALAYRNLTRLKSQFDKCDARDVQKACQEINPYEEIGNSIFMNRAAVKLANMDAVYKFTGFNGSIIDPEVPDCREIFNFVDIAAGPGGFTQYLQYRRPAAVGIGMTLNSFKRNGTLDWRVRDLDLTRFTILNGPDGTGNLYTGWQEVVNTAANKFAVGADLVTADGGFDVDDPHKIYYQEFLSSRLILFEILVALKVLKEGGNFVLKIFASVDKITADLLFALASSFDSITIFKPITSRIANAERYVICQGRRNSPLSIKMVEKLEAIGKLYTNESYITSFIQNLPFPFLQWLDTQNAITLKRETRAVNDSLQVLAGYPPPPIDYNFDRLLLIWSIPSTPLEAMKRYRKSLLNLEYLKLYFYLKSIQAKLPGHFDQYLYEYLNTRKLNPLLGLKSVKDLPELPVIYPSHAPGDTLTKIVTTHGIETSVMNNQVEYLQREFHVNWEEIYQLMDMYYPFGFVSVHPFLKSGRIDGFSNPFISAGNEYCSLFPSPGSLGNFFEAFPEAGSRWIIWAPLSEDILKRIYDRMMRDLPVGMDVVFYLPNWPGVSLLEHLDTLPGIIKELKPRNAFRLFDYTTGQEVDSRVDHVMYHLRT